ncbi:protein of unknown function [Shewanella benthica]|uniref:Uncharacterized protein n=1 Tax=Shewanella benthica TaxID=43661 RepID=A0A330MB41_9GAMM|nr:protein of unknown function [Shewanella benthica]
MADSVRLTDVFTLAAGAAKMEALNSRPQQAATENETEQDKKGICFIGVGSISL